MSKLIFLVIIGFLSFHSNPSSLNQLEDIKPNHSTQNVGLNIGDIAPELSFNGPDGKTYKLSQLKGKDGLSDCWA